MTPIGVKPVVPSDLTVIRIGGTSLALTGEGGDPRPLGDELTAFLCNEGTPNIEVSVQWVDLLQSFPQPPIFDSKAVWRLFRHRDEFVFDFFSSRLGTDPYKRLRADREFRSARLYLNRGLLGRSLPVFPLEYPTDELLFTNYLAVHGVGVEVHGCGLIDADTGGHLLLGHSGSGKSTTARLWQSLRNPEILSDDRIILRIENGELWMYGTPWHGEGCFASPRKARLNRILILHHGERNKMSEMSLPLAAGELFARSFPPFHSADGLQNVMDFLHRVVNLVPCFQFHFWPDASAVNAVLEMEHVSAIA